MGESDSYHISPMTPAPQYQPMESKERIERGEQKKIKGSAQLRPLKKTLSLLLRPSSPTSSNTRTSRSSYRDTKKGIKVMWYCEVLHQGDVQVNRSATKVLRVTRTGTHGTGSAP